MGPVSRPAPLSAPSPRGFGRGTSSVSARRHRVVWSGTARSSPSRPMTEPLGLPRLDRLVRKPDRQAAPPAQALVVIAPVRDLALLLRDVVASVLVQLEGQGGHPGSDGGLPCYLDPG